MKCNVKCNNCGDPQTVSLASPLDPNFYLFNTWVYDKIRVKLMSLSLTSCTGESLTCHSCILLTEAVTACVTVGQLELGVVITAIKFTCVFCELTD